MAGAAAWLAAPRCQSLFLEFRDPDGTPLADKLAELGSTGEAYLGLILFLDDPGTRTCALPGRLAYTSRGGRVVYLCGRDFERAWRKDPREAQATILHELLHTLGLGEYPPSPRHITHRVLTLCGP